jgi:hypothetical protein
MEHVTTAQQDRPTRIEQYGDLVLRLKTRITLPVGGQINLELPLGFDKAIGGTEKCTIGNGDLPYDNYKS